MKQLNKKEVKQLRRELPGRGKEITLVLENIQYARNVAAMFRTADAARAGRIFLTGISKVPPFGKELQQVSRHKEKSVHWEFFDDTSKAINRLKREGYFIVAVEITDNAIPHYELAKLIEDKTKVAFVLGSEVYGVKNATLELCDASVFIPMYGKGASLNVTTSGGIILYSF